MSFLRYEKYKDSGVEWLGEVPEHWEVKRLRFVTLLNPSKNETAELNRETEVSFLPMEAIGDNGILNLERTRKIGEVETGYTYFQENDVTIAKITPCFENGKGAVMRGLSGGIGFGTTELIIARPIPSDTTSNYLHWIFISTPFRKLGQASMYGAGGQKRVPDDFVRNFAIGFPNVAEQKQITTFLDREATKIDELITEQQRLIELLKEKRQAVISHVVTKGLNPNVPMKDSGVEWLGEVPEHWSITPLKHACSLLKDGTHLPPVRVDDGIPLLSVRNIIRGKFVFREDDSLISEDSYQILCRAFIPKPNDVLLAIVGATLGKVALIPDGLEKFHIQRSIAIFRPTTLLNPKWLNFVFQSQRFQQLLWEHAGYSAQPGIYLGTLAEFRIPLPSLTEQIEITNYLVFETRKLDVLTDEANRAIDLLQERRTALISAAVTGKIDVRAFVEKVEI